MSSFEDLEDDIPQEELAAAAAAVSPAPAPAPVDMRAKLAALAEKKRQEAAAEGAGKRKSKGGEGGGDGDGKKRKRDKGDGKSGGKRKGVTSRPVRQPGGGQSGQAERGGEDDDAASIDSREIQGTREDDTFIDDDGVDEAEDEGISEEAPGEEEARLALAPEAQEADGDEAEDAQEDPFGHKKRKRKNAESDQQMAVRLNTLIAEMEAAAEADVEAQKSGKPAVQKLKMLAEVEGVLDQRKYHELFIGLGGLGVIKSWLEPYKDGVLPNARVRASMINACKVLPIDTAREDMKDNLKKSQLGSRIMFLAKCPDETPANRKGALELVQKWARPIFFNPEAEAEKRRVREEALKEARRVAQEAAKAREAEEEEARSAKAGIKVGQPGYRWHAVIPQTLKLDYVVAPQLPEVRGSEERQGGGKKEEGKLEKRMREVVRKQKGGTARAAVPSVEGRGIIM